MKIKYVIFFLLTFITVTVSGQSGGGRDTEASRLATIRFGTEVEIAALIQTLRNESADYLDDELITLIDSTRNMRILTGVFAFFGEREKTGLENRAIRAIEEREDENNETVLSAIDYLGQVRASKAAPALMDILDTEERRFMNNAFRALGRVSSQDKTFADQTADFLIDFYENREVGDNNARDVIIAIGQTGSTKGVPLLIDIASNPDERFPLRMAAIEALSAIGDPEGLPVILDAVSTNDPNVRSTAVAALGPFSGEEVDKAILDAFRDSFFRTRIAATHASRDRKLEAAVPYLQFRAERDDVPNVRDEAIRALGAIGNQEANDVLEELFTNRRNSDRVRALSAEMLMKNNGAKNFINIVKEMDDAQQRNQTALYNGLLKVVGEAVIAGDTKEIEDIARRFLSMGGLMEKLYALDMVANNNLRSLAVEVQPLTKDRNQSIANKAERTLERIGFVAPASDDTEESS